MIFHAQVLSRPGRSFQTRVLKNENWDFHFHRNFEILYVLEGEIEYTVNGVCAVLQEGDFSMCLPNEIHAVKSLGDSLIYACIFSEDLVRGFAAFMENKEGDGFKFSCSPALKSYLKEVFLANDSTDLFVQKSCLYALCGEYLRSVKLKEKNKGKSDAVSQIIEFISSNYMNDIRLSDIAALLNYDYHYTSRLFRTLFNMPFGDYVTIYRLEKATELLEDKNKKVLDVAYESGFQSVRSFNDRFKMQYGVSPAKYRSYLFKNEKCT